MRIFFNCALLLFFSLSLQAQTTRLRVEGVVRDKETKDAVIQASVRLCTLDDTTMVVGGVSDLEGAFSFANVKQGKYLLVVSYVGYITLYKDVTVAEKEKDKVCRLGTLSLDRNVVALKEAVITGGTPKVVSKGDSLVFNSSAFRVPDGSMLQDLVKELPGIKVDNDGNITVNGESVSKIMIDGHEFFSNDMSMAMKNIPVEMIEKLKTYKKKSDLTRITGIDDGNEETVLDLSVKKDMSRGFFNNIDAAGGSKERYDVNVNVNRFKNEDKYTLIGSMQNVDGPWSNQNGTSKHDNLGFSFFNKSEKLELGGDANYSGSKRDATTLGSSENFFSMNRVFSNSDNRNINRDHSYDFSLRMEWKPDTMTNIIFRPSFNMSDGKSSSQGLSASFNRDPYLYSANPLDDIRNAEVFGDSSRINLYDNQSKNESDNLQGNASLQVYRKLNSKGRSITLRAEGRYSDNENDQFNRYTTDYYLVKSTVGGDSVLYRNQYITSPGKNYEYSGRLDYVEPIFEKVYLQFGYKYTHRYDDNDRLTYDLSPYIPINDRYNHPLGYLPDYYGRPDSTLSKKAEYDNDIHEESVSLRFNREKWNLSVGARLIQTKTTMAYNQGVRLDTTVTRNVLNFSPNLFFRYKFDDNTRLQVNYWGNTGQPSMTDMLPVRDDTNPMWVTEGNPNLESSFNNSIRAYFNTYNTDKQRGFNVFMNFNNTINSVSSKVYYNEETGSILTRPENINGNWSTSGHFSFNTALKDQRFSISTFSSLNYRNQVAYISQPNADSKKNTTRSWGIWQNLEGEFRNDWLELSLEGNINCNLAKNKLQPSSNMETYDFSYGANMEVTLPHDFIISTDIKESSRRGYADDTYNTNELIWNANVSYRFLKENTATLSLEMFDILQKRSNVNRWVSATSRSDTRYVGVIQSYWMLHFIYRFNIFGV